MPYAVIVIVTLWCMYWGYERGVVSSYSLQIHIHVCVTCVSCHPVSFDHCFSLHDVSSYLCAFYCSIDIIIVFLYSLLDDESNLVMETTNFLQELCLRAEEKVAAAELLAWTSTSADGTSSTQD